MSGKTKAMDKGSPEQSGPQLTDDESAKPPSKKAIASAKAWSAPTAPSSYHVGFATLQMPDSPLTPEDHGDEEGIPSLESDEKFTAQALSQQQFFLELADRVERGDATINVLECILIAGAVRAYAAQIYTSKPRPRGGRPKLNPLPTVLRYLQLRNSGMKKSPTIATVAEELDVSEQAIKDLLRKYESQISLLMRLGK